MPDIQMTKTTFILVECEARAADAVHCMIVLRGPRNCVACEIITINTGKTPYYYPTASQRRRTKSQYSPRVLPEVSNGTPQATLYPFVSVGRLGPKLAKT